MEDKGILVYCITNELEESISEITGMDGINKLYWISSNNLFAIISDVDLKEYSEESMEGKGEDIEWLKEKAMIFMDIMLKISAKSSIIPMKFLTIFSSEDRVISTISDNLEQFNHDFEEIKNREELNVKIYCDDKLYKEKTMTEEILNFEKTIVGKPKGTAFFLKKKFEGEMDDKIQNRICDIANDFINQISKLTVKSKSNKILAKEITGVEVPMILNYAFLIEKDQKDNLISKVEQLSEQYEESGFLIEFTGPWPPYNFCE